MDSDDKKTSLWSRLGLEDPEERKKSILQFLKFGLVGVSNTAISYGVEMLGYYGILSGASWPERAKITAMTAAGFVVSVLNSYFWNSRFVFADKERRSFASHLRAFLKMAASYALTGLVLAPILKIWISEAGAPYWLSTLLTLAVTIPLNYLLNKLWAFRSKEKRT